MEKNKFTELKPDIKKIEKPKLSTRGDIWNFKESINIVKVNPILAYLDKFDTYFKKKKKILEAGQILFSPGKDDNFYIIASWNLSILKHISDWQKKEIGKAYSWSFIWEWIIFWRNQKDVEAVADSQCEVFALKKEDLKKLENEFPQEAIALYAYIIEITNKRLLDSGKELANIYDATKTLVELSKNWEKWFLDIMEYVKNLLWVDYIIYIENHPAVSWFFIYKYNTKVSLLSKMNQKAWNEITENMWWHLEDTTWILWVHPWDSAYVITLKNNSKLKWYFIAWKKYWVITDNEMRISSNIGHLIGSIIENNQNIAESKAKEMKRNYWINPLSNI